MARKDRSNHLIEQFNENPQDPHKNQKGLWKAVKGLTTNLHRNMLLRSDEKRTWKICSYNREGADHCQLPRVSSLEERFKRWNAGCCANPIEQRG